MRWSSFLLGAAATVVGPRVLKAAVRTATKGVLTVRNEMVKAAVDAEKELEGKRTVSVGPTGQA